MNPQDFGDGLFGSTGNHRGGRSAEDTQDTVQASVESAPSSSRTSRPPGSFPNTSQLEPASPPRLPPTTDPRSATSSKAKNPNEEDDDDDEEETSSSESAIRTDTSAAAKADVHKPQVHADGFDLMFLVQYKKNPKEGHPPILVDEIPAGVSGLRFKTQDDYMSFVNEHPGTSFSLIRRAVGRVVQLNNQYDILRESHRNKKSEFQQLHQQYEAAIRDNEELASRVQEVEDEMNQLQSQTIIFGEMSKVAELEDTVKQ
jgi:hypothetical protein